MINYTPYKKAGFRFFGIKNVVDGVCQCDNPNCDAAYKHPWSKGWQHTPQWSEEQLDCMKSTGQFDTGIGVLVDDHIIIDVDPRNNGLEGYGQLCLDTELDFEELSGFVVRTGGDGLHIYFKRDKAAALVSHLDKYPGVDFKSSGFVVGAGSQHKSGNEYFAIKGTPLDIDDAPAALLKLLAKPDRIRAEFEGQHVDISDKELAEMLKFLSPDCSYDEWVRIGMALHDATSGNGCALWDAWSAGSEKYPGVDVIDRHWHSFGKASNPVTIGTLIHTAQEAGYIEPVEFESDVDYSYLADTEVENIDLLRPPGFVGELAKWINSRSRYPREHLAVAAALSSLGNICALGYNDKQYGVCTNQFIFCVAGSATGKEAIQQAQLEIHRTAQMAKATHGAIKSEQEVYRNLIEHQTAFYIIDEMGILLSKIANASRSGASYLEGVIGALMSIYSKADGVLTVTGDVKRDLQRDLRNRIANLYKSLDDGTEDEERTEKAIAELEKRIGDTDMGLERPFLSLIGYTTPVTFDQLVTREMATNGFFGRSLIVHERETNPKINEGYSGAGLPFGMASTISGLANRGYAGEDLPRIEETKPRTDITTAKDAITLLNEIQGEYWQIAEDTKNNTLEAIPRRCFELVLKVSLVLAIPEGVRTVEHVRWANAFVRRDMEAKVNLAAQNMAEELKRLSEALGRKIVGMLDKDVGLTTGIIVNRCAKYKREDVEKVLGLLETDGKIKGEEQTARKKTVKWFLA